MTEPELKLKRQMKCLGRHRDWYLRSLGSFLQMGFPPNHFTHVLIDDASQCTETECDCCSSLKRVWPEFVKNRSASILYWRLFLQNRIMWKQNLNGIHKALSVLQEVLKDSNKLNLQIHQRGKVKFKPIESNNQYKEKSDKYNKYRRGKPEIPTTWTYFKDEMLSKEWEEKQRSKYLKMDSEEARECLKQRQINYRSVNAKEKGRTHTMGEFWR
uniref:Uncharacterized protein n=1 Tax=Glossina austeni TaxID=7395 RepID=A0A1A9UDG5_GLOAU